ncbi:MAG: NDP-sugar synthase [Acidimicrobiia bacterium]|nr:NDP-sugar synthase [Acidimicrobiia bacterium]
MKAVILVGGEGTRLQPLTFERPKPMLPVAGIPFIERVLRRLARVGCDAAVLSACYRSEAFDHLDISVGLDVTVVVEDEPLGTGGAIRYAARAGGIEGTFLVLNGDVLTDVDLPAIIERHRSTGAEATIVLTRVDDPSRFGVVPTDASGRVERFVEKPPRGEAPTQMINAGTYVCEPGMLDRIPAGAVSVERDVFPGMAADGVLYAYDGDAYWLDFGTLPAYLQANLDCLDGRVDAPLPGSCVEMGGGEVWVDATAELASDVRVSGRVVLGPGSVVAPGARIGPSVTLGPKARVGREAHVVRSVLLDAAVVEDGARVQRSIVGDRGCVTAGRRLPPGSVVPPDQTV